MGCTSSNIIKPNMVNCPIEYEPAEPPLNTEDVEIIIDSWKSIKDDTETHGISMFKRLFKQYPVIQAKFYFAAEYHMDLEAIMSDTRLATHAKGVMDSIAFVVNHLEDTTTLLPLLKHLGEFHAKYDLKEKEFDAFGGALRWVLKKAHGNDMETAAVADQAWVRLMEYIKVYMKIGRENGDQKDEAM